MTRRKKISIAAGIVVLIAAAGLFFLWTNINRIVKTSIERYGSQVTKTSVHVVAVSINAKKGEGVINGITVANPGGFGEPHVLTLGSIGLRIDPGTLLSSLVVIDDVRVSSPHVVYEMDSSGTSNVDVLKKNIASADAASPKRPPSKKKPGKETRLRIKRLVIENGRVDLLVSALRSSPQTITLKKVEMTDIGGQSGVTPEQAAKSIANAIMTEVSREVAEAGAKRLLEKGLERAVEQMRK
ncbi:MAG TPA: AsmA family protein [Nitrospirota bacterium]